MHPPSKPPAVLCNTRSLDLSCWGRAILESMTQVNLQQASTVLDQDAQMMIILRLSVPCLGVSIYIFLLQTTRCCVLLCGGTVACTCIIIAVLLSTIHHGAWLRQHSPSVSSNGCYLQEEMMLELSFYIWCICYNFKNLAIWQHQKSWSQEGQGLLCSQSCVQNHAPGHHEKCIKFILVCCLQCPGHSSVCFPDNKYLWLIGQKAGPHLTYRQFVPSMMVVKCTCLFC